jgi:hypothetical protein
MESHLYFDKEQNIGLARSFYYAFPVYIYSLPIPSVGVLSTHEFVRRPVI